MSENWVFKQLDEHPARLVSCVGVLIILVAVALTVGGAYLEASTYNRLTGKHVSTWDALWVQLRVQEQVQE